MNMLDNNYELLLKDLLEKVKTYQMTEDEYRYISKHLSNKNFLVFGTGYDTPLWEYANRYGKTFFLEHDEKWIPKYKENVLKINYTCSIEESNKLLEEYNKTNYENLLINIPEKIRNSVWDCILVDSPPGYSREHHGRMQSIFTAKQLSNNVTNVFIHDCDREIEKKYASTMFHKTVFQTKKLMHVKI